MPGDLWYLDLLCKNINGRIYSNSFKKINKEFSQNKLSIKIMKINKIKNYLNFMGTQLY